MPVLEPMTTPVLEPTTQAFIDSLAGAEPIYTLTPEAAREVLLEVQSGPVALPAVDIEDRSLPVGPSGETRIRVIRPEGAKGTLPVIIYFHGAGWVMGDSKTHDRLVRELAVGAGAAVIFVDYERSPEHRYPIAIEQDYAVTKYVAEHPQEFEVDASRLAIAGDSVGGNMTAVVSLLAKERGGPAIAAQVLFYPVTDASMDNVSYSAFADGPWLTRPAMVWFWDAYLPDASARKHPHVSPLNASLDDLEGLSPALVITAENDVLRDEGEAYARKLIEAGVDVTVTRYNGTIHDFVMLNALAETPAARAAIAQTTTFLRAALTRD
ncbi:MAG: alpha/beta hydrolase [Myxococcota bacterium]